MRPTFKRSKPSPSVKTDGRGRKPTPAAVPGKIPTLRALKPTEKKVKLQFEDIEDEFRAADGVRPLSITKQEFINSLENMVHHSLQMVSAVSYVVDLDLVKTPEAKKKLKEALDNFEGALVGKHKHHADN